MEKKVKFVQCMRSLFGMLLALVLWLDSSYVYAQGAAQQFGQALPGAINQIGNQYLQMQQQQQQSLQNINQMQQAQQQRPQMVPSKIYPGCKVVEPDLPADGPELCQSLPPNNPQSIQVAGQIAQQVSQYAKSYDRLGSKGSNSPYTGGLQCLDDSLAKTMSQFENKKNAIEAFATQMEQAATSLKDRNNALLDQMRRLAADLYGRKKVGLEKDGKSEQREFSDYFSTSCKGIIGAGGTGLQTIADAANDGGLLKIKNESLKPKEENAKVFRRNKNKIKADVKLIAKKMNRRLRKGGLQNVSPEALKNISGVEFPPKVETIYNEKLGDFLSDLKVAQQNLDPLGIKLPPRDNNFLTTIAPYAQNPEKFVNNLPIQKCLTDKNSSVNVKKLIKNIRHPSGGKRSRVLKDYKNAVREILTNNAYNFEVKREKIRRLTTDGAYANYTFKVFVDDAESIKRQSDISTYFNKMVQHCAGQQSTLDGNSGNITMSKEAQIREAKASLIQVQTDYRNFVQSIANDVETEFLKCPNTTVKVEDCGNEGKLDPQNGDFCYKTARTCSAHINKCYEDVKSNTQNVQAELDRVAAQYNTNVERMVGAQEQILNQVKNQVGQDAAFIQQFLPGADFALPKKLGLTLPELSNSNVLSQALRGKIPDKGNAKYGFLEKLPNQIRKMKKAFTNQQKLAKKVIQDHINEQKDNMDKLRDHYVGIAKACGDSIQNAQKELAEQQKKQQEDAEEANDQIGEFCSKYRLFAQNPLAGCHQDKLNPAQLFEDANKVAGLINPAALEYIGSYSKLCNKYMNAYLNKGNDRFGGGPFGPQRDDLENQKDDSIVESSTVAELCERMGDDDEAVRREMIRKTVNNLKLGDDRRMVEAFLRDPNNNRMPSSLRDSPKANIVIDIKRELYKDRDRVNRQELADLIYLKDGRNGFEMWREINSAYGRSLAFNKNIQNLKRLLNKSLIASIFSFLPQAVADDKKTTPAAKKSDAESIRDSLKEYRELRRIELQKEKMKKKEDAGNSSELTDLEIEAIEIKIKSEVGDFEKELDTIIDGRKATTEVPGLERQTEDNREEIEKLRKLRVKARTDNKDSADEDIRLLNGKISELESQNRANDELISRYKKAKKDMPRRPEGKISHIRLQLEKKLQEVDGGGGDESGGNHRKVASTDDLNKFEDYHADQKEKFDERKAEDNPEDAYGPNGLKDYVNELRDAKFSEGSEDGPLTKLYKKYVRDGVPKSLGEDIPSGRGICAHKKADAMEFAAEECESKSGSRYKKCFDNEMDAALRKPAGTTAPLDTYLSETANPDIADDIGELGERPAPPCLGMGGGLGGGRGFQGQPGGGFPGGGQFPGQDGNFGPANGLLRHRF